MEVGFILEGFALIVRHRRFWRYIYGPLVLSSAVFLAVLIGSYFLIVPGGEALIRRAGVPAAVAEPLGALFYIVLWFFVSGFVFLAITSFMSSTMWEELSAQVEVSKGGSARMDTLPRSAVIADGVSRGILALVIGAGSLCCGWVVPVILPVLLAGMLGLLDYTASAYLRRNMTLGPQFRDVWRLPGWPGFLVVSGLITLVPILNVLMLPAMVAGGTIMVMRGRAQ